ncbi:Mitochondrial tRNAs modification protein [Recurvomyces mirabilis]|uniref:N(6)-L-threonylcarbamoyladenine synthase n=1 Tax=Recurvomyces mirabilis TaxID=574656 RepID=A0AAE0WN93_9PEZI|nr:Mitochondrial tRNAs modification protein [Recurvomyces mirabilis]KAK5157777.1 Mitochondrial tRNAs modification protein [Recurvomyces mirabilis]
MVKTLFHKRITANTNAYQGIHPLVALDSHRANLAPLLRQGMKYVRDRCVEREQQQRDHNAWPADMVGLDSRPQEERQASGAPYAGRVWPEYKDIIVAVTRGPGMRSNLSVGLDTAKGLAVALGVPLVAVHHMQAHALTPRLVAAQINQELWDDHEADARPSRLPNTVEQAGTLKPEFPFLSLLVSGGHTMLLESKGLVQHSALAETHDIALGELLDKAARAMLPAHLLVSPYGGALEKFAFHTMVRDGSDDLAEAAKADGPKAKLSLDSREPRYDYAAPGTQQGFMDRRVTRWGWSLTPPLVERKGGESKRMEFSFAGLLSGIERLVAARAEGGHMCLRERQTLAREVQRVAFEHLGSRLMLFLASPAGKGWQGDTLVVSGGVAANKYIQHVFRTILDTHGYQHLRLAFPPIELATDNALMIAWAGIEMYEAGWKSELDVDPIRRWSMDATASDGGILGVAGWINAQQESGAQE